MPLLEYTLGLENEENKLFKNIILDEFSENTKKMDLLEIGIGNGRFGSILSDEFKTYTGIEKLEEYLKLAKKNSQNKTNVYYELNTAQNFKFDKKFDIILFAFSYHLTPIKDTLNNCLNHLKDNGKIIILESDYKNPKFDSPRVIRGNERFDEKLYLRKVKKLILAQEFLKTNLNLKITKKYISGYYLFTIEN